MWLTAAWSIALIATELLKVSKQKLKMKAHYIIIRRFHPWNKLFHIYLSKITENSNF
jgi:hypothetical protein